SPLALKFAEPVRSNAPSISLQVHERARPPHPDIVGEIAEPGEVMTLARIKHDDHGRDVIAIKKGIGPSPHFSTRTLVRRLPRVRPVPRPPGLTPRDCRGVVKRGRRGRRLANAAHGSNKV